MCILGLRSFAKAAAAFLMVGLASCGAPDKQSEKVLRVTRNIGGREGFRIHFEAWKAAFEKRNPDWTMELIDLGNASGADFYKSKIATGDLPDIVMTWQLAKFLSDGGHLVPLEDAFYTKFGIPPPPPYKGKRYTSQSGIQVQGMAINKKMWNDAGISTPPATWDEFLADLQKLKDKGYTPLVYGGKEWSATMPLFLSLAANLYHDRPAAGQSSFTKLRDERKVLFATDPTAKLVLQKVAEMMDRFVLKGAGSDGYNEEQRDFYTGKGATWLMGCWLGGDLEPHKVGFEVEYWPIPSMTGKTPIFVQTSEVPNGWAITASATGEKLAKARAAMELFYDPHVYQLFLNGEMQLGLAEKVDAKAPKSDLPAVKCFVDSMVNNVKKYGTTPGWHLALDDFPPLSFEHVMRAVSQEMLAGNRDFDKLLKMLDDDWDQGRKGE
jgi:ABC-type glycerol-3-phosphate transport system substrate-binding protein